jgi:hypothetical protein
MSNGYAHSRTEFRRPAVLVRSWRCVVVAIAFAGVALCGCRRHRTYGIERALELPGRQTQTWAVAPVLNLTGYQNVDPLLQADLLYQQLQQVEGITAIPVNRVAETYAALHLDRVQSDEQAAIVCEQLGCDALLIATVTAFDPYNPPKFGAALQLFYRQKQADRAAAVHPRELVRRATPPLSQPLPATGAFVQVVGMFDASNGSTRRELDDFAQGRTDPAGPLGAREFLLNMDRYCGFAYAMLIADLLHSPQLSRR